MTFLLYIGKNKDFLRKFSKLENVQMIYAQNYQDAITICIRLKVRENIIVLHEQGEMNGDIENRSVLSGKSSIRHMSYSLRTD